MRASSVPPAVLGFVMLDALLMMLDALFATDDALFVVIPVTAMPALFPVAATTADEHRAGRPDDDAGRTRAGDDDAGRTRHADDDVRRRRHEDARTVHLDGDARRSRRQEDARAAHFERRAGDVDLAVPLGRRR